MVTKTQSWVDAPISPYRLAGVLSEALGQVVAPQVLYQKTRNGSLPFTLSETGHQTVSAKDANSFIQSRLDAEAAKAEASDTESENS